MALTKVKGSVWDSADNGLAVNVKDFGAVGDGVADDTASFVGAYNAGFPVFIPKTSASYLLSTWSEYSTTGALTIRSDGATVDINNTATNVIKALHDIDIEGVAFTNCASVVNNLEADVGTVTSIKIRKNKFDGCKLPIAIELPYQSVDISHNEFVDGIDTQIRLGKNDFSLQDGWKRSVIIGNNMRDLVGSGSVDVRGMVVYGREAVISGNVIDGLTGVAGAETHGIYTKVRRAAVVGNTVRNPATGTTVTCINIKGNARAGSGAPQGYTTIVANNTAVCGTTSSGIRLLCDDLLCIGNIVDDPKDDGIGQDAGDFNRVKICNNKIYGTLIASTVGIRQVIDGDMASTHDNEIYNMVTGIRLSSSPAKTAKNLSVTNNQIEGGTTAIAFNASSVITNVKVSENQIGNVTTGIRLDGTAPDDVLITDNKMNTVTNEITWGASSMPTNLDLVQEYRRTTTDATTTSFFTQAIPDNSAHVMKLSTVGMKDDGSDRAMYEKQALLYRDGGGATIQGSVTSIFADVESAGASTWVSTIGVGANDIRAQIVGQAATTVNWSSTVRIKSVI